MSDKKITIIYKLKDKASKGITSIGKSIKSLGKSLVSLKAVTVGLTALTAAVGLSTRAWLNQRKVLRQTEAVLRSTGSAAGLTAKEINALANELALNSNYADEAIQSAANLLLTFKSLSKDTFPEATQAVLDISAAMGTDLKSSAIQVGKALNDPKVGLTALSRVGITFTEQQKESIKTFQEQNDILSAQKIILQELQSQFAGSANAQKDSITRAKNSFGDLLEVIGERLTPAIEKIADSMELMNRSMIAVSQNGGLNFKSLAKNVGLSVFRITTVLLPLFKVLKGFGAALNLALNPSKISLTKGYVDLARGVKTLSKSLPVAKLLKRSLIGLIKPLSKITLGLTLANEKALEIAKSVKEKLGPAFAWVVPVIEKVTEKSFWLLEKAADYFLPFIKDFSNQTKGIMDKTNRDINKSRLNLFRKNLIREKDSLKKSEFLNDEYRKKLKEIDDSYNHLKLEDAAGISGQLKLLEEQFTKLMELKSKQRKKYIEAEKKKYDESLAGRLQGILDEQEAKETFYDTVEGKAELFHDWLKEKEIDYTALSKDELSNRWIEYKEWVDSKAKPKFKSFFDYIDKKEQDITSLTANELANRLLEYDNTYNTDMSAGILQFIDYLSSIYGDDLKNFKGNLSDEYEAYETFNDDNKDLQDDFISYLKGKYGDNLKNFKGNLSDEYEEYETHLNSLKQLGTNFGVDLKDGLETAIGNLASDLVDKTFFDPSGGIQTQIFDALKGLLGADAASFASGLLGGVVGQGVLAIITSIFGSKPTMTTAQYAERAFDRMVSKTNRAIENLGKEKKPIERQLDLLEDIKDAIGEDSEITKEALNKLGISDELASAIGLNRFLGTSVSDAISTVATELKNVINSPLNKEILDALNSNVRTQDALNFLLKNEDDILSIDSKLLRRTRASFIERGGSEENAKSLITKYDLKKFLSDAGFGDVAQQVVDLANWGKVGPTKALTIDNLTSILSGQVGAIEDAVQESQDIVQDVLSDFLDISQEYGPGIGTDTDFTPTPKISDENVFTVQGIGEMPPIDTTPITNSFSQGTSSDGGKESGDEVQSGINFLVVDVNEGSLVKAIWRKQKDMLKSGEIS